MNPTLDLFTALALPFAPWEVKERSLKGKTFHYITARTVCNRLDEVLGPDGWWDSYRENENSVVCRLTIRLPDGSTLTREDAGGGAGMADLGDDDKSAYSDALKRAAVKFGCARYLYCDGVPAFAREAFTAEELRLAKGDAKRPASEPMKAPARKPEPHPAALRSPFAPQDGRHLYAWLKSKSETSGIDVLGHVKFWAREREYPTAINRWSLAQVMTAHAEALRLLKDSLAPSDLAPTLSTA